jgi:hypothetical protein
MKNLFKNTYKKILYYKEYESPIRYGYKPEHKVKSYVKITKIFDFKEGLRYVVTVPNVSYCYKKLKDAFLRVLEHESIGMAKYNRLKEDMTRQDLFRTLNLDYIKK